LALNGTAWIDAAPAPPGTVVQALVGDIVCGEGAVATGSAAASPALSFNMNVSPAASKAGCGAAGATLSFTIGGKLANEKLAWDDAAATTGQAQLLDLSAGPAFAAYSGALSLNGKPAPDGTVIQAMVVHQPIDDPASWVKCAELQVGKAAGLSTASASGYAYLPVLPDAIKQGCGKAGTEVWLKVQGCVYTSGPWEPGFHKLDLTSPDPCIPIPNTGSDASSGRAVTAPASGGAAQTEAIQPGVWWAMIGGSGLLTVLAAIGLAASMRRGRKKA
jgi:hypothetical protein